VDGRVGGGRVDVTVATGGAGSWLRPLSSVGSRGPVFARDQVVVHPARRLGELVEGRPPGVTGHQWSSAIRTELDFVVCAAGTGRPVFAVEFATPTGDDPQARRAGRMRDAVCAAVGLPVLRISSATLRAGLHGRWIVEYVLDARRYTVAMATGSPDDDPDGEPPVGFRDIVGRLPDGRQGHVNDLGAVARSAAVDAYVNRQLVDPIIRGLHLRWRGGPAEGWCWVQVRPGRYLVERVRLGQPGFSCGVDPARLAEDLAAVAIGERLRRADFPTTELVASKELGHAVDGLRARRDEVENLFDVSHLSFD
jgi:hypothetical protein